MFCTTLRQRQALSAVVPSLVSSTALNVKESRLTSHDLVLPLSPTTHLYILLLSSQDLLPESPAITAQRLAHFTSLTTPDFLLIVLVEATLPALAALQIVLLDPSLQTPAVLLTTPPPAVPDTIMSYVVARRKSLLVVQPKSLGAREMLRLASDGYLSDLGVRLVGDVFRSLGELGHGCAAFLSGGMMDEELRGKMETLAAVLPGEEFEGLVRFWG